ncbi:MAG: hypothetical protein KatS3mg115_0133 [Candidatus Poribacteria bacterium]|nr:MAG: hypothetical protein KatS3mg115_0133 [Candidatus Poribacteria bacterium]
MERIVLAIALWVLLIVGVIGAVLAVVQLGGDGDFAKYEGAAALALTGAGLLAFLWARMTRA